MDETSILNVASEQSAPILSKDSSNNYSFLLNTTIGDHDYSDNFSPNLSMYAENVVEYIAGFVVRKLKKPYNVLLAYKLSCRSFPCQKIFNGHLWILKIEVD
jgi:hypothetical protein